MIPITRGSRRAASTIAPAKTCVYCGGEPAAGGFSSRSGAIASAAYPWQRVLNEYKEGDVVDGKVTKIVAFGAFVQILPGVEGLVHISELAQHHVESPAEVVRPGDELKVKILEVDDSRRRLSLSVKRVEGQELPTREVTDDIVIEDAPEPEGELPAPSPEAEATPEADEETAEPDAAAAEPPEAEAAPSEEPPEAEAAPEAPEAPSEEPAEAPSEEEPPAEEESPEEEPPPTAD